MAIKRGCLRRRLASIENRTPPQKKNQRGFPMSYYADTNRLTTNERAQGTFGILVWMLVFGGLSPTKETTLGRTVRTPQKSKTDG